MVERRKDNKLVYQELESIRGQMEDHEKFDDERFSNIIHLLEDLKVALEHNTHETIAIRESVKDVVEIYNSFGTIKKLSIATVATVVGIASLITSLKIILPYIK